MLDPWSQGPYLALLRKATEAGIAFGGQCTGIYVDGRHVWLYRLKPVSGRRQVVRLVEPEDLANYVCETRRNELAHLPFSQANRGPRGDVTPPEWKHRKRPALAQVA